MVLAWIFVGMILLISVGGPFFIRFKQVLSANALCEPANMHDLPMEVVSYLTECTESLGKVGFVQAGTYWVRGVVPSVEPVVALYINRPARDKAMATVIFS